MDAWLKTAYIRYNIRSPDVVELGNRPMFGNADGHFSNVDNLDTVRLLRSARASMVVRPRT